MERTILISISVEEFQNIITETVTKCLEANNPVTHNTVENEIMNIEEVARFLHLAKGTIYKLVMNSQIPVNKKGKRLFFLRSELIEWVKTGRRKTHAEIEQEANNYILRNKKKW